MAAQDAGGTLLPDIDPQDIEIRGDFTTRFTGITRQPILGFSPTPRVFRIDPNRMPFLENQAQVVASLPISDIDRPVGPSHTPVAFPDRNRVVLNAGFGTHFTPEARLVAELPVSKRGLVLLQANHVSTNGTTDNQASTAFRMLNGDVAYRHHYTKNRTLTIGSVGRHDFSYFNVPAATPLVSNSQTEAGGYLQFRQKRNVFSETDFRIRSTYTSLPFDNSEVRLHASLRHSFTLDTPGQWMSFGLNSRNGLTDWGIQEAVASYHARIGHQFEARIGGRAFYGWDQTVSSEFRVYPDVSVAFTHPGGIIFKAELGGGMDNDGLAGNADANRFYRTFTPTRNDTYWNMRGLAQYAYRTGIRVEAGVEARLYSTWGFYEASGLNVTRAYDSGRLIRLHGATSVDIVPERLTAFGTVYLQNSKLDNGSSTPFHESIGAHGGLSTRPTRPILMSVWADWTGPRNASLLGMKQDGYVLLGASFDYRINRRFGLYVKGTNLLNESYNPWIGYPLLPIQAYGGFTLVF